MPYKIIFDYHENVVGVSLPLRNTFLRGSVDALASRKDKASRIANWFRHYLWFRWRMPLVYQFLINLVTDNCTSLQYILIALLPPSNRIPVEFFNMDNDPSLQERLEHCDQFVVRGFLYPIC